jgi:hypothetical protein
MTVLQSNNVMKIDFYIAGVIATLGFWIPSKLNAQVSLRADAAGNLQQISAVIPATGVTVLPSRLVVKPGEVARFSAFWAKRVGDTVVWKKGGTAVAGQTGDAFSLASAVAGDEADYTVTVTTPSGALNSTAVHLYIDSDGDGLGDSWETTQFGNLVKRGDEDSDTDGVTNAEEFEDGTNANSNTSRNYRLTLQAANGRVIANPVSATGRYPAGTRVTLQATPAVGWQFREWSGDFSSFLPGLSLTMSAHRTLAANFYQPVSLAAAAAQGSLTWTTGGSVPWLGENAQATPEGTNLVHSGNISAGQESWIETTVAGPGTLSWWWRVSCDRSTSTSRTGDWLRCYVDGELVHSITGNGLDSEQRLIQTPWQPVARTLTGGGHTVRWVYQKDALYDAGEDMGWVDKVAFTPAAITPTADGIDVPGSMNLTLSGADLWYRQTTIKHDGNDALQSSPILDDEEAWLEATVVGPGVVNFWWKVSSSASGNGDLMEFWLDGTRQQRIYGEQDWVAVQLYLTGTEHKLLWRYIKDSTIVAGADAAWLDEVSFTPSPTLGNALDNNALAFSTGGAAPWITDGTSAVAQDGVDSARSGIIGNSQQSWVETTVSGPGTLSFWWSVSSYSGADFLNLLLDGTVQSAISGSPGWARFTLAVPPGSHTVRWSYSKDANYSNGNDAAYLDSVMWTPGATLGDAVDAISQNWSTTGDVPWIRQTTTTKDGSDAAQAGPLTASNQTARMTSKFTGPGVLSFWWKSSCASTTNTSEGLRLLLDGVLTNRISGEQDWVQVTKAVPPGALAVSWEFVRPFSLAGTNSAWVDAVTFLSSSAVSLASALDSSGLTFTTGGSGMWAGYTSSLAHDAVDIAASPTLANDSSSWVETTVNGPGTLNFWWRVSSETNGDYARFYVNGYKLSDRSGEIGWQPYSSALSPGAHTIRWAYEKDANAILGDDAAYLDEVTFTPSSTPPLADAIDNTAWSWHTSINGTWNRQTAVTHDGVDAAQAGAIGQNESTYIGGVVTGPGTLSFWWKIGATTSDRLYFFQNSSSINSISGNVDWVQVTQSVPVGEQFYWWRFDKYSSTAPASTTAWLDQVTFTPNANAGMASALDISAASPFVTGGTSGVPTWASQTSVTHDGIDALKSPTLTNYQNSWYETTVSGPGILSFWYKLSSLSGYDNLEFYLENTDRYIYASGEVPWTKFERMIGPGAHRIYWQYTKNSGTIGTGDGAWVDQISVAPLISLAAAVDTALPLTTGGTPWEGQPTANLSHDGVDRGASGLVSGGQESWMETTITGPGTLSYFWSISAYSGYDYLRLLVDGVEIAAITGSVGWQEMIRTLPSGTHTVRWNFQKGTSSSSGANQGYVDQIVFTPTALPPLADAVDQPVGNPVTASGVSAWARTTTTKHDGSDAAQSGVIGHSESSWFEMEFTGPGTITYWWKVSSQQYGDYLRCYVDDVDQQNYISGEVDWMQQAHYLAPGAHRCRWHYSKNSSTVAGSDAAWLDQVTFLSGVSLAAALDTTGVSWRIGGANPWLGFSNGNGTTDEAVSGTTTLPSVSWVEATFTGPGTLSYNWKLSTSSSDYLRLSINADEWGYIRGTSAPVWETRKMTIPAGSHVVRWTHEKNYTSNPGEGLASLDQVSFTTAASPPLNDAVDEPAMLFLTGGNAPWDRQTTVKHDGLDAAQAGALLDSQVSWMFSYIDGPGLLTYWAKVSSEASGDYLRLYTDGSEFYYMSGEVDWRQIVVPVPEGRHSFEWNYRTDAGVLTGSNRGWVDQINFTAYGNYPIANAMDTPGLTWSAGPAAMPATGVETAVAHDVIDAVLMPSPSDGSNGWLETTIQGATLVKFWWRADVGRQVQFFVDGILTATISGNTNWAQVSTTVDASSHQLRWEVARTSTSYPFSAVWLDELTGLTAPTTTTFQQWQTQFALSGVNAVPLADFDKDGVTNLVEFAFNLDPTKGRRAAGGGSTGRLPIAQMEGSGDDARLVLEYLRRRGSDLVYTPQFSDDLSAWSPASGVPVVEDLGDGWELVRVPDSVTVTGRQHRSGRVKVTLP